MDFIKKWKIELAPRGMLTGIKPVSIRVNKQNFCFITYRTNDLKGTPFQVKGGSFAILRATKSSLTLYRAE